MYLLLFRRNESHYQLPALILQQITVEICITH